MKLYIGDYMNMDVHIAVTTQRTEVSNRKCSYTIKKIKIFPAHSYCSVDADTIRFLFVRVHTLLSPVNETAVFKFKH
jgi:hypothetical protein